MKTYTEKDFVEVVDGDGQPVPGFEAPVPASWVGTDLLPKGTKKKGRSGGSSSSSAPSQQPTGAEPPAGNAGTEVWAAWAVEHGGATEEDVKDMSRDDLREKYGKPAS